MSYEEYTFDLISGFYKGKATIVGPINSSSAQGSVSYSGIPIEGIMTKNEIRTGNKTIKLKENVAFKIHFEGGVYICENNRLNIVSYSHSLQECIRAADDELSVLWDEIVEADDSDLAPDALELKKYLVSLLK